jgi:pyridoxine 5-phosphate synthase
MSAIRLGINIDHVATVRNARGGEHPSPIRAALIAKEAGAGSITAHLREDRRHINDADIARLKAEVALPLNLEMAATGEMLAIALHVKPAAVCLVPENRQELTTEGGLDAVKLEQGLIPFVSSLKDAGIRVSLFVDADPKQIEASKRIGATAVEIHTGTYAKQHEAVKGQRTGSLAYAIRDISDAAKLAHGLSMEVHAGHGLNYENVMAIAAINQIIELNIGHFLMGEAMFVGLKEAIQKMRAIIDRTRA